jgi:hypothetical protein
LNSHTIWEKRQVVEKTVFAVMLLIVISVGMLTMTAPANGYLSVTISPSSPVVAKNSTFTFTATVAGGAAPYQYSWTLFDNLKVPVAYGTGNPWNCSVPSYAFVGKGNVTVVVVDSQDNIGSAIEPVLIVPLYASVSPGSVTLDIGQPQAFKSSVLGGTSPYYYQWYLDGSQVSGATGASWTYRPSSAGSHTVCLKAADSAGHSAMSNTVPVTVNAAPSVTISPSSASLDVGQSQLFTSTVTGGTSPYSYQWYLDNVAVSGAAGSSWTCTLSAAGSHTICVKVTDSASAVATSNATTVTVNDALSVTISPGSVSLDVGQSQLFNSTVSGGMSPFVYQWYLNGAAVSGATSATWTFAPRSYGFYSIYVNVTDSVSFKAKSNVASVVVSSARYLLLTAEPDEATYSEGQMVTFSVDVLNQLCPALTSTLTLTVTGPSGYYYFDFQGINVTVNSVNEYSFTWNTPNAAGTYIVEVSLVPAQLTAYDAVWLNVI